MSNSIILLGSNGMLGQMVKSFFDKESYDIITYNRQFDENSIHQYVDDLNSFESSVVINCVGRIKQKAVKSYDLLFSNSILPLELSRSLKPDHLLIHPSTDCVFDGVSEMPYLVGDKHTAKDFYGISKSLGETALMSRSNTLILRVSIIGPDNNSSKGLLSWFLNIKPNSELNGFTNHIWNGITTLEWCEKLSTFLNNKDLMKKLLDRKLIQLGTNELYTKFDMLNIFNNTFERNLKINKFKNDSTINRCLKSDIVSKSLEEQVSQLKDYMIENYFLI